MEQKFQFKTNINCSGCVEKVTPYLDAETNIQNWSVDTANQDKVLTVISENMTEAAVVSLVQKAGYKAEPLPK